MSGSLSILLGLMGKACAILLVANEVRGLILTAPVFYGLYQAGGTLMAIWIAFCSLAGIALSVMVPLLAASNIKRFMARKAV